MNELTLEEKQIVVNLLQQISLPIKEAPIVIDIINKILSSITPTVTGGPVTGEIVK
jgi:hypothetical protein